MILTGTTNDPHSSSNSRTKESVIETVTRLEPLDRERARELFSLLRDASADDAEALVLDSTGRVVGRAPANDPHAEHLLGDLDVHA